MTGSRFLLLALAPLVLVTAIHANRQEAQQAPTFRTAADVILIDVNVADDRGNPVSGIRPQEFKVTVDGVQRTVLSANFVSLVSHPGAAAGEAGTIQTTALTPTGRVSTNVGTSPGRLVVLAPDVGSIAAGGGRGAMEAAVRFLDRLSSADQVALVSIPVGPMVDFTGDRGAVRAALQRVMGMYNPYEGTHNIGLAEAFAARSSNRGLWIEVLNRECAHAMDEKARAECNAVLQGDAFRVVQNVNQAAAISMSALRRVVDKLADVEGPKILVLISEGLVSELGGGLGAASDAVDLRDLAAAMTAARVDLFVLHLDASWLRAFDPAKRFMSYTANEDADLRARGLQSLAGYTQAALERVIAGADHAFDRLARESSAYYLLAVETRPGDRDGRRHQIRVTTARGDVRLRARTEVVVRTPPREAAPTARVTGVLRTPVVATGLPVRVVTYLLHEAPSKVRVMVAAEVGAAAQGSSAGAVTVGYRLVDATGAVIGSTVEAPAALPAAEGGGSFYSTSLIVGPGDYTLKLAALDAEGRTGGIEHRFSARLPRLGDLDTSELLLATRPRGGASRVCVGSVGHEDVEAYLELVGPATDQVRVRFNVTNAAGDDLAIEASPNLAVEQGRLVAQAPLQTTALAAGDYVVRATVTAAGRVLGSVECPFRKR